MIHTIQRSTFVLLVAAMAAAHAHSAGGAVIQILDNEPFDDSIDAAAHGWAGQNNSTPNNAFDYSESNHTGGASPDDEAGGIFDRLNVAAYYADTTLGGTFNRSHAIQASGEFDITNINAAFNNGVYIAHFDTTGTSPTTIDLLGLQIAEQSTSMVRMFAAVRYSDGTSVLGNQLTVTGFPNSDRLWSYTFNPIGGPDSIGQLVFTINGPGGGVSTLNLLAADAGRNFSLNGFGLMSPGFGGAASTNNISLFIDNATYSALVFVPEPSTLALTLGGFGMIVWRRRRKAVGCVEAYSPSHTIAN